MINGVSHLNYDLMKTTVQHWGTTVPDWVYVISCLDPTAKKLKLPKARHLTLRFLDLDVRKWAELPRVRRTSQEGVGWYTVQQAKKVAGFVKPLHTGTKPILLYVHGMANYNYTGSASMAAAINWWLEEGPSTRRELPPNPWVFTLTMAALIEPEKRS